MFCVVVEIVVFSADDGGGGALSKVVFECEPIAAKVERDSPILEIMINGCESIKVTRKRNEPTHFAMNYSIWGEFFNFIKQNPWSAIF